MRYNQQEIAPENFSPVFNELTERFGLILAGDKIVIPDEMKKKQLEEALHVGLLGSMKMLAESNIFCWSGMRDQE